MATNKSRNAGVTGAGFDTGLIELTVGGLDSEALAVGLIDAVGATPTDPLTGIH